MKTVEVEVCVGTACHLMGSPDIITALEVARGKFPFAVEIVYATCLNSCGRCPVVKVNGKLYPDATPDQVLSILTRIATEIEGENHAKNNI